MPKLSDLDQRTGCRERRRWGRFVSDVGQLGVARRGRQQRPAEVLDESFGGIGLLVPDAADLAAGVAVDLTYDGTPMQGVVKSVVPDSQAGSRVGIEWASEAETTPAGDGARIEGSLFMLIRMWETGAWSELRETADRLISEADDAQFVEMARSARTLRERLDGSPSAAEVLAAVEALVDAYTNAEPIGC